MNAVSELTTARADYARHAAAEVAIDTKVMELEVELKRQSDALLAARTAKETARTRVHELTQVRQEPEPAKFVDNGHLVKADPPADNHAPQPKPGMFSRPFQQGA